MTIQWLLFPWLSASALLVGSIPSINVTLYDTVIQISYKSVQGTPAFSSYPISNISNWQDITT